MKLLLFCYLVGLFSIPFTENLFLKDKKQAPLALDAKYNVSVIGVFEIIRHGARTPIDKGDTNNFYLGTMRSQLTINGLRQHLLLGRWIRERYVEGNNETKLFNSNFNEMNLSSLEIISSHRQRSIFSSASHLLGMFPNTIIKLNLEGHTEIRNTDVPPIKNFDFDPRDGREVTINVLNGRRDNMFKAALCHQANQNETIIKEMRKKKVDLFKIEEPERKKAIDEILKLYEDVVGVDGIDLEKEKYSERSLRHIISFLRPFKYHYVANLSLSNQTMETISKSVLNKFWNIRLEDSTSQKLLSSSILDTLYHYFLRRADNTTDKKFYLLSGFDNTIADVLGNLLDSKFLQEKIHSALNNQDEFNFLVPPVASSIIFELLQDNDVKGKYFVRIIYNGRIISGVFKQPIRVEDSQYLDLKQFLALVHSRIDKNYDNLRCDISE